MAGLHELIDTSYAAVLQEPAFRLTIEAHKRFFLKEGNYKIHPVDDHEANKYRFDLHGYLTAVKEPSFLHFAIMRQNGMTSPTEFSFPKFTALIIPSEAAFKEVVKRYRTISGTTI